LGDEKKELTTFMASNWHSKENRTEGNQKSGLAVESERHLRLPYRACVNKTKNRESMSMDFAGAEVTSFHFTIAN
jgi:hypothetical protein